MKKVNHLRELEQEIKDTEGLIALCEAAKKIATGHELEVVQKDLRLLILKLLSLEREQLDLEHH